MEGFAFRAYIPALNGEVLRANPIKSCSNGGYDGAIGNDPHARSNNPLPCLNG